MSFRRPWIPDRGRHFSLVTTSRPCPRPTHPADNATREFKNSSIYVFRNIVQLSKHHGHGRVVSTPPSYLGRPDFKSRPRDRQQRLSLFLVFLSLFSQISEKYHDHFLVQSFKFIIHLSSHPTFYIIA